MADELPVLLQNLIDRMSAEDRRLFLEAIQALKGGIDYAALLEHLKNGNIESAIDSMNIGPEPFNPMRTVISEAYQKAGDLSSKHFPKPPENTNLVVRFDMDNPRAEEWLRQTGGQRITGRIAEEQLRNIRATILQEYQKGSGPDNMVVKLAGRYNRTTGRRDGGIIGLSAPQLEYVDSMRSRAESGDAKELRKILRMEARDKRYDTHIKRAISEGKPVEPSKLEEMVRRYESRLLERRARAIGRSEVAMAVMSARMESWRQGLDKTGYPEEAVIRTWRHGYGGEHPRAQHVQMNGVEVLGLTNPFVMPDGTRMMHAHDPAGGAKHVTNCTCDTLFEIDYSYGVT